MRVLSAADVAGLLDLEALLPVIEDAFRKQGRGAVERPERPHFPIGTGLADPAIGRDGSEPAGTGLVMPAYVHGQEHFATKVVGVNEANPERGLPTVNAAIALTEADTGLPAAHLAGNAITNARTGCIGGLAVRELAASEPVTLGVIGAGTQARWQARAIAAATTLDRLRVYSPSDSRAACAADLRERGLDATAVDSAAAAVRDADAVVTATTARSPVFDGDDLAAGAVVVAVGAYTPEMRELDGRTVDRAARLFADVPAEAAATGDFPGRDAGAFTPLSAVFEGEAGRRDGSEILVVASVGTAVLDAATATFVHDRAVERGVGTDTSP